MISLLVLIISSSLYAGEGVITVLETPLFSAPSKKSQILQYKRKGDTIYINEESFREDVFSEHFTNTKEELLKTHTDYQRSYPDVLFRGEFKRRYKNFYRTLTRSGREAFIIKDHVFLSYNDKRELTQEVIEKDPTDYRIEEPLPDNYPLIGETGYRGQVLFSIGTPTDQPYPYSQSIRDTGFDFNKEVSFVWAKQVKYDVSKRFFFGGEFHIMSGKTSYITKDINATESQVRVGIGPYLTYDLFRRDRHTINIQGSIVFNFYDSKEVKQKFSTETSSRSVTYLSRYFSPKIGLSYHLSDIIGDLDLITGVKAYMHSPHTYEQTETSNEEVWVPKYKVGYSLEQSYFFGIQTAY
jgi:hypothetical protein